MQVDNIDGAEQYRPTITVDEHGRVYLAWRDGRNGNWDIYVSCSENGGVTWMPSVQVNDDNKGVTQSTPSIAVDSMGRVYLAWRDERNGNYDIYSARSDDGGQTWTRNIQVNYLGAQAIPSLTVNRTISYTYAAWEDTRHITPSIYFAYATYPTVTNALTWSTNVQINDAPDSAARWPSIVTTDAVDSRVCAAWQDERADNWDIYFACATVTQVENDAAWDANMRINSSSAAAQVSPTLATDPQGNMYAVWTDKRDDDGDIYFAWSSDGGMTWQDETRVNDLTEDVQTWPYVAADQAGNVFVVWMDHLSGTWDIRTAYAQSGDLTNWEPSVRVNDDVGLAEQRAPSIDVDSQGRAYVMWQDQRRGEWDIYGAWLTTAPLSVGDNYLVSHSDGNAAQREPVVTIAPNDQVYGLWDDHREGYWNVYEGVSTDEGISWQNEQIDDRPAAQPIFPVPALMTGGVITGIILMGYALSAAYKQGGGRGKGAND